MVDEIQVLNFHRMLILVLVEMRKLESSQKLSKKLCKLCHDVCYFVYGAPWRPKITIFVLRSELFLSIKLFVLSVKLSFFFIKLSFLSIKFLCLCETIFLQFCMTQILQRLSCMTQIILHDTNFVFVIDKKKI